MRSPSGQFPLSDTNLCGCPGSGKIVAGHTYSLENLISADSAATKTPQPLMGIPASSDGLDLV
ncbi:hypothetical protein, partial [Escherichia coli]|uniref:hypothetical protein n=1 Tax=Escherichia coli TaxID=562 RepID=UPI001963C2BF